MQNNTMGFPGKDLKKEPGKTLNAYLIYSCFHYRTKISISSHNILWVNRFIYHKSDRACLNRIDNECHLNWVRFEFNPRKTRMYLEHFPVKAALLLKYI